MSVTVRVVDIESADGPVSQAQSLARHVPGTTIVNHRVFFVYRYTGTKRGKPVGKFTVVSERQLLIPADRLGSATIDRRVLHKYHTLVEYNGDITRRSEAAGAAGAVGGDYECFTANPDRGKTVGDVIPMMIRLLYPESAVQWMVIPAIDGNLYLNALVAWYQAINDRPIPERPGLTLGDFLAVRVPVTPKDDINDWCLCSVLDMLMGNRGRLIVNPTRLWQFIANAKNRRVIPPIVYGRDGLSIAGLTPIHSIRFGVRMMPYPGLSESAALSFDLPPPYTN